MNFFNRFRKWNTMNPHNAVSAEQYTVIVGLLQEADAIIQEQGEIITEQAKTIEQQKKDISVYSHRLVHLDIELRDQKVQSGVLLGIWIITVLVYSGILLYSIL